MFAPETKETVGLNQCHDCGAELLDRDKFCRRCGVKQTNGYATSTDPTSLSPCETRPLTGSTGGYSSYSGQLIRIVTESLSARTTTQSPSRGFRRLVCMLITIPIWMLIVMLSPLDAYTAAKAAAECVS
jgi:hypothetical protein